MLIAAFSEKGKFLLAARRYRRGAHNEYIISLDADDLSQGSQAYVGKLRYGWCLYCEVEDVCRGVKKICCLFG